MPTPVHYFTETAAPPTPPATKVALYAKVNKKLYWLDDAGNEHEVAAIADIPASVVAWPIGSVFLGVTATNPNTLLGYGTWVQFGKGKMLVGQDPLDVDFDTAEETGGAKTHTQTAGEVGTHTHVQNAHTHVQDAHTHTQNAHNHTQDAHNHTQDAHTHTDAGHGHSIRIGIGAGSGAVVGPITYTSMGSTEAGAANIQPTTPTNQAATATNQAATATNNNATATNQNATAVNQNAGAGDPMNIMNPYIVVYMWKRTA